MISFDELRIGSIWKNVHNNDRFVVAGKENRIVPRLGGWIKFHSIGNPVIFFEADWEIFAANYEEIA
jgi:hypothetical protein